MSSLLWWLTTGVVLAACVLPAWALEVRETTVGTEKRVTVTSRHFDVTFTSLGGRVVSFVEKPAGREHVLWAPGEGGWFDDRGTRTMAQYDVAFAHRDAQAVELVYSVTDDVGLRWKKTYAAADALPGLRVSYEVTNGSGQAREYEQMIRNFITPEQGLTVFCHSDQGVQKFPWGDWGRKQAQSEWISRVAGDWLGLLRSSGGGLAIVCSPLSKIYLWTKSPRGTFEPVFPKITLEPGQSVQARVTVVPVSDFTDLADATDDYLLGFSYVEKVKEFTFQNRLMPISARFATPQKVTVRTQLLDMRRKPLAELPAADVTAALDQPPPAFDRAWKAPADGMYILDQKVLLAGQPLGGYETPVIAGFVDETAPTYHHPKFPVEKTMLTLRLGEEDLARGWFLSLPTAEPVREVVETVGVDLCRGETEFVEFRCVSFVDLGEVAVAPAEGGTFPGQVAVFVEHDDGLYENRPLRVERGGKNAFFVRLSSAAVPAGEYRLALRVAPPTGPAAEVALTVKVWPLDLPRNENLYVTFFWSSFECLFKTLYPKVTDRADRLRLWRLALRDQRAAGQEILEIRPDRIPLSPFITVKEFKDGRLPVLDLTNWDEILDIAREEGMRHALFRYGWMNPAWQPKNYKDLPSEQQEECDLYALKQLCGHLKARGFQRLFWYLIDELDPTSERVEAVCAQMDRTARAVPDLEFAGSGFASTPLPVMQKMADRLTWIAPYWSVYNIIEWMTGGQLKLRPNTIIGTQASGDWKTGYTASRRAAWQYWKGGLTGYQVYGYYTYYPKHGYSCVRPDPAGPVPTATLFGLIDAWQDFQLLHALSDRAAELDRAGRADDARRLRTRIEKLVGPKDAILGWTLVSSSGFVSPAATGDDQAIRRAKAEVLQCLTEFEK